MSILDESGATQVQLTTTGSSDPPDVPQGGDAPTGQRSRRFRLGGIALVMSHHRPADGLRLHPDEEIVLEMLPSSWWTLGRFVATLGLWAIWRKRHRFILTNQRIIVSKGIVSKSEQSVPLSRVQDAHMHRSPLTGGRVALSTAGGSLGVEYIGPLTQADALTFADALTPRLGVAAASV
jgi:hypothetical protein